MLQQKGEAFHS